MCHIQKYFQYSFISFEILLILPQIVLKMKIVIGVDGLGTKDGWGAELSQAQWYQKSPNSARGP